LRQKTFYTRSRIKHTKRDEVALITSGVIANEDLECFKQWATLFSPCSVLLVLLFRCDGLLQAEAFFAAGFLLPLYSKKFFLGCHVRCWF